MVLRHRPDGTLVSDLPPLRRIVPYLLRGRVESTVYFPMRIEVDDLLAWLEQVNAGRPADERITLFHVFLAAISRTIRLRPETNRFIAGRRTYQRDAITISFIVKRHLADEGDETEVRVRFTGHETVDDVRRLVEAAVRPQRAGTRGADDRLTAFFMSWPRPVLEGISHLIRRLDYHNALPTPLMGAIPLYTSAYVVNTGSLGIDPPFHHLYEYGTASVFVAIGRVGKEPVVDPDGAVVARSCVNLVCSLDERATDGFYFARTAEVLRRLISTPELLADPGLTVADIVPTWPPQRR